MSVTSSHSFNILSVLLQDDRTALIFAAQGGHDAVVDVLIKYDADVLVTDKV